VEENAAQDSVKNGKYKYSAVDMRKIVFSFLPAFIFALEVWLSI